MCCYIHIIYRCKIIRNRVAFMAKCILRLSGIRFCTAPVQPEHGVSTIPTQVPEPPFY